MADFFGRIFGGNKNSEVIGTPKEIKEQSESVQQAEKQGYPELADRIRTVTERVDDQLMKGELTSEARSYVQNYATELLKKLLAMKEAGEIEFNEKKLKEKLGDLDWLIEKKLLPMRPNDSDLFPPVGTDEYLSSPNVAKAGQLWDDAFWMLGLNKSTLTEEDLSKLMNAASGNIEAELVGSHK